MGNSKALVALIGNQVLEQGAGCTHWHQLDQWKDRISNGHKRPNVKAQRHHFVKIMHELGKEPMLGQATMCGILENVIEERMMEV